MSNRVLVSDCARCGQPFEQPRRRGRPFRSCEACRDRPLERSKAAADPNTGLEALRRLPEEIARQAARGAPIVVELPPTLSPAHQGLMGALGVLVRFKANT